jgi:hypothetical protein
LVGVTLISEEAIMTADAEVLASARDYADGNLSTSDLYEWLARRPISDDLEADLWGLAIAVDARELAVDEARTWVAGRIGPPDESEPLTKSTAFPQRVKAFLISIPRTGSITFQDGFLPTGRAAANVSTTESWWAGVERTPPLAVPA